MTSALVLAALLAAPPSLVAKNRGYDVQKYRLEMTLDASGSYQARAIVTLKPSKSLLQVELDAYDLAVTTASIDGQQASVSPTADVVSRTGTITLKLKSPIAANREASVELVFTGKASSLKDGFFSVKLDDGSPAFFTQLQPLGAQRLFPCNDEPSDRAAFELFAVVDQQLTVLSNGKKLKDETFTEGGKNLRRVEWKMEQPIAPGAIGLAIGRFEAVPVDPDLPATLWVRPGQVDKAFVASDALKELQRTIAGLLGTKYPYPKLDVVAAPKVGFDAVENTTLIAQREQLLVLDEKSDQSYRSAIAQLLAHQVAHQWFGGLVNAGSRTDSWLNDGFATAVGWKAWDSYNDTEEAEVAQAIAVYQTYPSLEPGSTRALKAASMVKMLEQYLTKQELKAAYKSFFEENAGKTFGMSDFFKAVVKASSKDKKQEKEKEKEFKVYQDAWLGKKGYPILFPKMAYSNGKVTLTLRQQPSRADDKVPFVFKLPIHLHRQNEPAYDKAQVVTVDKAEVSVDLDVPALPDWVNFNVNAAALVGIDLPSLTEDSLVLAARHDPDPTWRLFAAWALLGELGKPVVKEETKPTISASDAVLDVLNKDPSPYVREAVLQRLADTGFKKLPPEFSAPIYTLAKRPDGLNEDPQGTVRVRRAAMEALGRTEDADAHKWLMDELIKPKPDLAYLSGLALGAARLNSNAGLASLRAAITTQKARGFAAYRRTVEALASVQSLEAVPLIKETLSQTANEPALQSALIERLKKNRSLAKSTELAQAVKELALDELAPEGSRLAVLSLLEGEAGKKAAAGVAAGAKLERVKAVAATLAGVPVETGKKK